MRSKFIALGYLLAVVVINLLPAASHAADRLQGAWVIDATTCDTVFARRNGKLVVKRSLEGWSGFIVDGKSVRGANASCTLRSTKHNGDVTTFLLDCSDKIMFGSMSVSARFENDDRFIRFDPNFPEVQTVYNRCSR